MVWLAVVAALVAAALLIGRWNVGASRSRVLVLEDGGRLRLLATTQGTNHLWVAGRFPDLDPLRRAWRPLQSFLGAPTERLAHPSPVDALGVFHVQEDATGKSVPDPYWVLATVDEHGCRLTADASRGQFSVGGYQGIAAQNLECYPRRAARIGIEFGSDSGAAASNRVRLDTANRRPWTGAEWVPEALPMTREVDGLRFILLGLGDREPRGWPRFRIERDGVERPEWETAELWFHDVTGNRAQSPSLCRFEPAWKIEARFRPKPELQTDPEVAWDLGTFDVPEAGSVREFDSERRLQGVKVRPVVLGGAGIFEFNAIGGWHLTAISNPPPGRVFRGGGVSVRGGLTGNVAEVRRSEPWLALKISGLAPEQRWTVVAIDESGQAQRNSGWSGVDGDFRLVNLAVPEGTRRVGVRVVVDRLRIAEYLVAPPRGP